MLLKVFPYITQQYKGEHGHNTTRNEGPVNKQQTTQHQKHDRGRGGCSLEGDKDHANGGGWWSLLLFTFLPTQHISTRGSMNATQEGMKDQQVNNKPNDTKSTVGKGGCSLEGDKDHNNGGKGGVGGACSYSSLHSTIAQGGTWM